MNDREVVDCGLLDCVLLKIRMIEKLKDVHNFKNKAAGISDYFLLEWKVILKKNGGVR